MKDLITSQIKNLSKVAESKVSKAVSGLVEKTFGNGNKQEERAEKVPKKIEIEKEIKKEEKIKLEEPKVELKEQSPFEISFVKEICTIPSKITVKDKAIYKTISLKNTGKREWPANCVLKNIAGIKGQDTQVVPLAPGKEFSCILILENPAEAGEYVSAWRLAFLDEKNNLQYTGQPFDVSFKVIQPEISKPEVNKEEKKEAPVPVIKKEEEKSKKVYDKKITEKAGKVKEIFPDINLEDLCEFIKGSQNLTIDELVENYMA